MNGFIEYAITAGSGYLIDYGVVKTHEELLSMVDAATKLPDKHERVFSLHYAVCPDDCRTGK